MKHFFLWVILGLIIPNHIEAATYYVDQNIGSDSNSGTEEEPWLTIQHAADTVAAGDTVRVQAGTYPEIISVSTSGVSGDLINFVAQGSVTTHGWIITGDYVRVIGFVVEGDNSRQRGIYLQNADYVELWNNTVQNFWGDSIPTDNGGNIYQSDNCIFIGNKSINSGLKDFQVRGNHNVVAYNEAAAPQTDFIYIFGGFNRIHNNYSHDINAAPDSHCDFFQSGGDPLGLHDMLYEANLYLDEAGPHHHGMHMETNDANNDANHVLRGNVWHNMGSYVYGFSQPSFHYRKTYNESIVLGMLSHPNNNYMNFNRGDYPSYFNNIFYQGWGANATTAHIDASDGTGQTSDSNIYFHLAGNIQYSSTISNEPNSQRNTDPALSDVGNDDFTLTPGSPARNAGGALTRTVGSGSGNTFSVADATFFRGDDPAINQYDGQLVTGDIITVGTDVLDVVSISGNSITVSQSFSWDDNDPVFWGNDATPDIGALPYKTSFEITAAYVKSGGTVDVSPNDPDLVRYVVLFENGIPVGVDADPPYSISGVGDGVLDVRVYPRYASSQLWVTAQYEDLDNEVFYDRFEPTN